MDDLAIAAGVSKGSLYDYFQNKEDLFYAVFEWFQQLLMRASLERLQSGQTARERILEFADASVRAFVDHIALYPVMLEVWAAAAKTGTRERFSQAMRALYVAFRAEVSRLIEIAQANGEIRPEVDAAAISGVLIGAVDGLLLQFWLDPGFDPQAWVRRFLDALFDGIATETQRRP